MTTSNEVRIENCTICNYSCKFCPHPTASFTRKKEIMSNDLFKFLLTKVKYEAPQITDCTISGFGEPFLDKGIMDKIAFASSLGYNIHIVTNGVYIFKNTLKEMADNDRIKDIRYSLHTTNSEHYEEITSGKIIEWASVMTNIKHSIKLGINTIITADIIEENKDDVDALIKYWEGKPVTIEVWKPHNWVDWGNYRKVESTKLTCGRPFNGPLQVQVDGTVNMCCFDYNGKLEIGDLKTQSLNEIFNSDEYKFISDLHSGKEFDWTNLMCKSCDQRKDNSGIVIYNNKFTEEERLGRTSTNYRSVENEKN